MSGRDLVQAFIDLDGRWARVATRHLPVEVADSPWRLSAADPSSLPGEGWKLHLSATIRSAPTLLRRAGPILNVAGAAYKGPKDLGVLAELNAGTHGYSQVGKCITVYCRNDAEATALARALDRATAGLAHPRVPYDLRYGQGAVYYRYGAFAGGPGPGERGASGWLRAPGGGRRRDRRGPGQAVPAWMANPLPSVPPPQTLSPLAVDYRVFEALKRRGKGGVYLALDLTAGPAALCIVKEGRRHGETDALGFDGQRRARREATVLRALRRAGVAVPKVLATFSAEGNHYVVMEHIDGVSLATLMSTSGALDRAHRRVLAQALVALVAAIHDAGFAWRDLKPENLIVTPDWQLRPIDFEGAWRDGETPSLPWSTPPYRAPLGDPAGPWQEDLYALGVVLGELLGAPSGSPRDRPTRAVIARLTAANPGARPSAREVAAALI